MASSTAYWSYFEMRLPWIQMPKRCGTDVGSSEIDGSVWLPVEREPPERSRGSMTVSTKWMRFGDIVAFGPRDSDF
jgi:hypothetical protein